MDLELQSKFWSAVLWKILAEPWIIAHQAPLSVGLFQQEYWSGLPFPSPGDLPSLGIEPVSPVLTCRFFYHWTTWEAIKSLTVDIFLQGFGCGLATLKCKEVIFWLFQSKESFEFLLIQPSLLLLIFFFCFA